jgi:hypothetical protein
MMSLKYLFVYSWFNVICRISKRLPIFVNNLLVLWSIQSLPFPGESRVNSDHIIDLTS